MRKSGPRAVPSEEADASPTCDKVGNVCLLLDFCPPTSVQSDQSKGGAEQETSYKGVTKFKNMGKDDSCPRESSPRVPRSKLLGSIMGKQKAALRSTWPQPRAKAAVLPHAPPLTTQCLAHSHLNAARTLGKEGKRGCATNLVSDPSCCQLKSPADDSP